VVVGLLKSRRTTTRPSLRDGVPATSGPTAAAIVGRIAVAHAERCRKAVDDPAQRRFRRLDSLVTLKLKRVTVACSASLPPPGSLCIS